MADKRQEHTIAACALHAVPGIGNTALHALAAAFGSLHEACDEGPQKILARADDLKLRDSARDYLARDPDLHELGNWALQAARSAGAKVLLLDDPEYPRRLALIDQPPMVLYVRGHLAEEARRVALVGARNADDAGLEIARTFGDGLARARVHVVSGGARGVDVAAHEGALWGQGQTVVVLGCGIDVVYPPENKDLFERVAKGAGAIVSEFPPATPPAAGNFPRRNRTISGLADAVVVIRAALKSGAMITADYAAAQGRPIFAVPGDPGNPTAAGTNELLRLKAALPAWNVIEVLEQLGWAPSDELRAELAGTPEDEPQPETELFPLRTDSLDATSNPSTGERLVDEVALQLWQLLDEHRPAHVDELAQRAQIPVARALRKLAELERKGMSLQRPGKYFLRR